MEVCCIPSATRNLQEDVRGDVSPGPASQLSSSQDPEGGRHDPDTQPMPRPHHMALNSDTGRCVAFLSPMSLGLRLRSVSAS